MGGRRTGGRGTGRSAWWRSPVTVYLVLAVLAVGATLLISQSFAARAAREEALSDARATTQVLALSVAEPAVPRGLQDGAISAVDRFDRVALERLRVDGVRRIKLWREDGTIVYSDDPRQIGERYDLGAEEREILREGGSEAEVSDLTRPENRYEPRGEGLVEVYTRIRSPEGEPLLFETYFAADGIDARQAEVLAPFRQITLVSLGLVVAVATVMLAAMRRREARAAAERERLLRNAVTASEAERRRIARDLHDGVVQDLAASAFATSTLARDEPPERREALLGIAGSLRTSMRSLRSLLVEIHPPDLTAGTLAARLQDLLAPAEAAGVVARASVDDVAGVPEASLALVWRVAQEAVRNALRHAGATGIAVTVRREDGVLRLDVTDDGVGFDPAATAPDAGSGDRLGLRGLRSLATDGGGRRRVRSTPGAGTTVTLEVPA
ncbi:sensor histidine kinase [Nocardioides sp.]|uniref:sensor histidine kinase n=1 Tax=Nocardioides sp. TaxID=35761 RepID=UPI00351448F0